MRFCTWSVRRYLLWCPRRPLCDGCFLFPMKLKNLGVNLITHRPPRAKVKNRWSCNSIPLRFNGLLLWLVRRVIFYLRSRIMKLFVSNIKGWHPTFIFVQSYAESQTQRRRPDPSKKYLLCNMEKLRKWTGWNFDYVCVCVVMSY
jgi:hypothetical protein